MRIIDRISLPQKTIMIHETIQNTFLKPGRYNRNKNKAPWFSPRDFILTPFIPASSLKSAESLSSPLDV